MNAPRGSAFIALALTAATSAAASTDEEHGIRYRLAMRAMGVREALAEMMDDRSWEKNTELFFQESHVTPPPAARVTNEDWEDIRVPVGVQGQDLVFQEQFVMAGREDDFEDAAEKWVQRKLKGSDAAAAAHGHNALSPRVAWDHGPLIGVNRGRFTVMGGEDQLHAKWTQRLSRPGWYARISAGTEEGDETVAFSLGRSMLHASRRR